MFPATMESTSKTASAVVTPAPPAHLSAAAKQEWTQRYIKAHAQARIDHPENPSAQRTVALKSANTLLSVPAPQSAADIEALEPWQVLLSSHRVVNGVRTLFCVTTDGRKYSFPVESTPAAPELTPPQKRQSARV
jgi:hypothetical protein